MKQYIRRQHFGYTKTLNDYFGLAIISKMLTNRGENASPLSLQSPDPPSTVENMLLISTTYSQEHTTKKINDDREKKQA